MQPCQVRATTDKEGNTILNVSFGEQGEVGASTGPMTGKEGWFAVDMLQTAIDTLCESLPRRIIPA